MQLMPFPEIMTRLHRAENLQDVAKGSGLSYRAVLSIKNGVRNDPKLSTLERLTRYFESA